jgi:hypothetical protein
LVFFQIGARNASLLPNVRLNSCEKQLVEGAVREDATHELAVLAFPDRAWNARKTEGIDLLERLPEETQVPLHTKRSTQPLFAEPRIVGRKAFRLCRSRDLFGRDVPHAFGQG